MHLDDAEDAVSEAFARAASRDFKGDEPIGGWLNVVTQNIIRRQHRDRARADERHQAYAARLGLASEGPEEAVCDRLFASSVAQLAEHLPDRQRRALELKADGLDVAGIAAELGEPYKAVESLLSRARTTMRWLVAASLTWVVAVVLGGRRWLSPGRTAGAALATTSIALVLAVAMQALPSGDSATSRGTLAKPVVAVVQTGLAPATGDAVAGATTSPEPRPAPDAAAAAQPRPAVVTPVPSPSAQVQAQLPLPEQQIEIGHPGGGTTVTAERHDREEPPAEAIQRCLRDGPSLTLQDVGCPPQNEDEAPGSAR